MAVRADLARVAALCLVWAAGASAQQAARDFLDSTVMHEVRIDIDPDDWAALKQNYLDDTYYHANITSGPFAAFAVGIRSRGRGSRSPDKPNLDINVDKYAKKQTFANLGFFILKANNQDPSAMHEMLAFELYRKMGLPAPREAPARLFINGEYFGYYCIVERIDEDFLDRNLGESGGDLFEWKPNDFYHFEDLGDDPAPYANLLDPKTNEDNPDYQPFIRMVKAIDYSPDGEFSSAVSHYLDLKLYLTLVATENAIAEVDGLWESVYGTNNIYVYRLAGQDLFLLMPWDKDLAFWDAGRALPLAGANVLARRLLAVPEYRAFYLSQLSKAAELMGAAGGWADREVERIYAVIHDAAADDPFKQCVSLGVPQGPTPCGPGSFDQAVRDLRSFIGARAGFVRNWLAEQRYQPPTGGPTLLSLASGGEVAPGAIATFRGIDFGQNPMTGDSPLPRSAGRTFVAVDGVRAPLVSISDSEFTIQIPWDIPIGTTSIAVAAGGAFTNTLTVPVAAAAPNILAVAHADGAAVSVDRPADRGEILALYATGLGAVDTPIGSGDATPPGPLIRLVDSPSLQVDSTTARVMFVGLTPGTVGLYQVNLEIPAGIPSGTESLVLTLGNKTASMAIAIR